MADPQIETVLSTARLAGLDLEPEEAGRLGAQLARILEAFRILAVVDTEGVEPMTGPAELSDVLREDEPRPSLPPAALLDSAPERIGDFYGVPPSAPLGGGGAE